MRNASPHTQAIAQRLSDAAGPDTTWVTVLGTSNGRPVVIQPDDQHPGLTAQYLADGLHSLVCSGCDTCAAAPSAPPGRGA